MPEPAAIGSGVNRQARMIGSTNSFALDPAAAYPAVPLALFVAIVRGPG